MDINQLIQLASVDTCKRALTQVIGIALNPSLGSASKRELELAVLDSLIDLKGISTNPTVFELMRELRISKGRARGLLYDRDNRSKSKGMLDEMARGVLSNPRLQSKNYAIALDIDNPWLCEYLKDVVRGLGHTSDGSFSASLIQLNDEAAAALIELYVPEVSRKAALKLFQKAGMKDKSLKGVLLSVISQGAKKVAGETGSEVVKQFGEVVGSLISDKAENLGNAISSLVEIVMPAKRET